MYKIVPEFECLAVPTANWTLKYGVRLLQVYRKDWLQQKERVNKNSTSYNHSHHLRHSRLRDSQHSEDTGWDHLRSDPSIYFVSLLDNSSNQSQHTIAVNVACRAPFDTVTTLNSFFLGVDLLCQETSVKLCKVTHSWGVIDYNIKQE